MLCTGLGAFERLAEADSPKEAGPNQHVFTYRAAIPDGDRVRATAQLTTGGDGWGSANSFSARQLWEWMPVDIFVQTIGTTSTVPDMSELTSSGVRLSEPHPLSEHALVPTSSCQSWCVGVELVPVSVGSAWLLPGVACCM